MEEYAKRLEYLKRLVARNVDIMPKMLRAIERMPEGSREKELLLRQYEALKNYTSELVKIIEDQGGENG